MTSLFARIRSLARNLFRGKVVDRDLDEELRGYVDMVADEKIAAGLAPEQARREARIALGGVTQVKDEVRRARAGALLEQLAQDVRYAFRGLGRARGFAAAAIATLALGIGTNTAMFSVIDALLFRPLAVSDPDRLVAVYRGQGGSAFSYPHFRELAERRQVFAGLAAWGSSQAWLRSGGSPERIGLQIVSPNYFSVLGVSAVSGSTFAEYNDAASRATAVIGERLWRSRLGGDPSVVGRTVTLNGQSVTIVGVAPESFVGLAPASPADAWVTFATLADLEPGWNIDTREEIWLNLIGRLAGATPRRSAESALASSTSASTAERDRLRLVAAATPIFDPDARASTSNLAFGVGAVAVLVLLIACANVANLLIIRGAARAREIGVRLAVGASRGRVLRQMITESIVLWTLGGVAGLLLANWTVQAVLALAPPSAIPPGITVTLDARVMIGAAALALVTGLLFGAIPAWHAARTEVLPAIKGSQAEPSIGAGALMFRRALVVTQVTLSTVLVVGAGLFLRTLVATVSIAPGYDVDRVVLASVDFGVAKLDPLAARAAGEEIRRRVEALPGIESTAFAQIVPFSGAFVARPIVPDNQVFDPAREDFLVPYGVVSSGFFRTLGMPLRGRDFEATDTETAPRVAIVNETLARRYWPGQDPIGQRLRLPLKDQGPAYEVIGVVPDGKYVSLTEPQHPFVYLAWAQMHRPRVTLHVRTAVDAARVAGPIRDAIRAVNGDLPAVNALSLRTYVDRSTAQPRVVSRLLLIFGSIALLVAAVGVYGLTAYTVVRRTKEVGVRVALGASPNDILMMLVRQGAALIVIGLGVGIGAALLLSRFVETLLFGVTASDPITFGSTAALLALTMVGATLVPARRAVRVDPLAALRVD
jgi:putative ABC transport system permease protein